MSNGNTLPWVIALVASIVGAGAIGFVGGRSTAEPGPAPVAIAAAPAPNAQPGAPQGQPQDPNALPPGMTTEPSGDWTLVCQEKDGRKGCGATQNIQNDQKQIVLDILAVYGDNGQKVLVVSTPLRVDLASGLEYTVPGKAAQKVAYTSCNQLVCQAILLFSDDDYAALDKQGNFDVAYMRGDGVKAPIKVSMKGLTDAFAKMPKPPAPAAGADNGVAPAAAAAPDAAAKPVKPSKPTKPANNGG